MQLRRGRAAAAIAATGTACLVAATLGCASFHGARLYTSGSAALDRGEIELAVSDLKRATDLLPEASEVHNHLGLAYQAAGRRGDAHSAFRRAVDLDCDNTAAAENLRTVQNQARSRREDP